MAGAFLSDALRQQAIAEMRGQMLQDQIAKQVSQQIIGQIANQEIGRSMQSLRGRGQALQSAADRTSRREVGKSQLEMRKDIAKRQKLHGMIGTVAGSLGALGAHLAVQGPDPSEGLPEAKVPTREEMVASTSAASPGQMLPSGSSVADVLEKVKTAESIQGLSLEDDLRAAQGDELFQDPSVSTNQELTEDEFQKLIGLIR